MLGAGRGLIGTGGDIMGVGGGGLMGAAGGIESIPRRIPSLMDLTPGHPMNLDNHITPVAPPGPWDLDTPHRPWEEEEEDEGMENMSTRENFAWENSERDDSRGALLRHRLDPSSPTRSTVTLRPTSPVQVICYAKNRVGRTRVPCTYTLSVVGKYMISHLIS